MPRAHSVTVECQVPTGFAVDQVRGMFDLAAEKTAAETFEVELPEATEDWLIGVIVGPSGSGKTSVARKVYGKQFCEGGFRWEKAKAVVDHFAGTDMRRVAQTLTSVGFSSPPSWLKPHHVLSGGERFRCDLARALLKPGSLIAFDEFTSVVDRNVAQIGSAAIAKAIRKGHIGKQFVAVTCHYDVLPWLEPDWVLDMATQQLARGCLQQRPVIGLDVAPVHPSAWQLFRRHHYLNTNLKAGAKCFVAFWGNEPVAFSAWIHRMTTNRRQHDMREHRTVVLPDYQGVGIGNRVSEYCASIWTGLGGRAFSTTSHPGMIHYRNHAPAWRTIRHGMVAGTGRTGKMREGNRKGTTDSAGRITAGFQYVGPQLDAEAARQLVNAAPPLFLPPPHGRRILDSLLATSGASGSGRLARIAEVSDAVAGNFLHELERSGYVEKLRIGRARVAWALTEAGRERWR